MSSWKDFWSKDYSGHFENYPSFQISWTLSDAYLKGEKFIHQLFATVTIATLAQMAKVASLVARPRKCYINGLEILYSVT